MWTIHSIGDSAFLAQILNAVAMVAGTGELAVVVRIGFGLGVLLLAFSAVMHAGRGVEWQQIAVAWVAYAALFGPGVRVAVEDAYTDQIIVVDNVPLGVAAVGSIMSVVGYGMTNLFETAFATPSLSEQSYGMSLKRLATTRQAMLSRISIGNANRAGGAGFDMERSWSNYIIECTLAGIDLGIKQLDEVLNDPLPEALEFADGGDWYYTEIRVGGPPRTLRCDTAFDELNTATDAVFLPALKENLRGLLGKDPALSTDDMLSEALAGVEEHSLDVDTYLKAIYLTPIYYESVVAKHEIDGKHTYAAMVNNAIQQRNAQWRAQKNVFETSVQPLLTFVEGFFYAITPIMAMVIGLGRIGLGMAGKYLAFALWIQFWLPLMAIVNSYLHMAAAGEMAAMTAMAPELSLSGVLHWDGIIQHYLSVGGMLATSVPLLSLFIVTGSYYAMTHFSGKIEGADHVDERRVAPDAMARAPLWAMDSHMRMDPTHGSYGTGTLEMIGSTSFSQMRTAALSSAQQRVHSAQTAFSETLNSTLGAQWSRASESNHQEQFAAGLAANYGHTSAHVQDLSRKIQEGTGIDRAAADQIAMATAIGGGANLEGGKFGLTGNLRFGVEGSNRTSEENKASLQRAVDIAKGFAHREDFQADLARAMRQDIGDGIQDRSAFQLSDQDSQALSRASSEMISAQESYSRTDSDTRGWEDRKSISNLAIVNALGADEIQRVAAARGVWGLAENILGRSYRPLVARGALTLDQAAGLAGLDALRSSWTISGRDAEQIGGDTEALFGLAQRSGLGAPGPEVDAHRNAGLEAPGATGVRGRADAAAAGNAAGQAGGVRGAVAADRAQRQAAVYSGAGLIEGPDGKGGYTGLAAHDAALAELGMLQRVEAEQRDQLAAILPGGPVAPGQAINQWFLDAMPDSDPRVKRLNSASGSAAERHAVMTELGREMGLSERQAQYVAGMSLADGNLQRAAVREGSGLDPLDMRTLDAWMSGDHMQYQVQYLDRLRALNETRDAQQHLIREHHLVPGDPDQASQAGLAIEITRGRAPG